MFFSNTLVAPVQLMTFLHRKIEEPDLQLVPLKKRSRARSSTGDFHLIFFASFNAAL